MTSVFASRKSLSNKVTWSTREKNLSPIAGMRSSFKNTFPLDRKKSFPRQQFLKTYKKWFVQARKFVSTNLNEAFVEKYVSIIQKTASSGKKIKGNGFGNAFL